MIPRRLLPSLTRRLALTAAAALLLAVGGAPAQAVPGTDYVYVHATGSSPQVYAFAVETDGSLTPVAGSPFSEPDSSGDCEGFCNAVSYAAGRNVLLTAGGTGISSFSVGTDGSLATTSGSPYPFQINELSTAVAAVDVGGRTFAYATQYYAYSMDGFEVAADGSLSRVQGLPITGVKGISVMGGGGDKIVYLDETHRKLRAFKVAADGTLKAGKPVKVAGRGALYYVTVAPNGKVVYTGEWEKGRTVYSYRIADTTAKLTRGPSVKLKIKDADGGISLASNGLAAVFASGGATDVQIFSINSKGKFVRRGGPQASGLDHVTAHAWSTDGKYLIAASTRDETVRTYAVDPATGLLTTVDTESAPVGNTLNGMSVVRR